MEKIFSLNTLRPRAAVKVSEVRRNILNHVAMGACSVRSLGELAETLTHEQWVKWHWAVAPDSHIRPEKSVFPLLLLVWPWLHS